jgi:hypothetical protein
MRLSNVRSACKSLLAPSRAYQTTLVIPLLLLCIAQAHGQFIVKPPTVSAPVIQSVPGTCADYNTTLTTTGVQVNGASNPGHCAKSQFTPLFNGQLVGTNWQQLMLGPNPPKFKETITQEERLKVCITATDLAVDLSARVDVSELNWVPVQTIGPVCTKETNRANTAPMISAQNLLTDAQSDIEKVRLSILRMPDTFTECAPSSYVARSAVQQKIWQELKQIATEELNLWHDPENALAAQCAPQCSLCNSGWAGTLTCKKTVSDSIIITNPTQTNYTWNETQTWIIGGIPVGTTQYPATFTATGGGNNEVAVGNQGRITWTVNVTAPGTLTVFGTQQAPSFQTSPIRLAQRITSTPSGAEADEIAFQIPSGFFQLSPNTYTYGSRNPPPGQLPYACDTARKPGSVSCQVDCSWDLAFQ